MTYDEAVEAGALVAAAVEVEQSLAELEDRKCEPDELIGVSLGVDHSDAGSTGLGGDVLVPAAMARATMEHLRGLITDRLCALGVTEGDEP